MSGGLKMAILTSQLFPAGDMNIAQYITTEIADGAASIDVTLDATADLTKTWAIILNASSPNEAYCGDMVTPTFTDANTVRFTKGDVTSSSDVVALIVTSAKLVSLQYVVGNITLSNATAGITITAVDAVNNLVIPFITGTHPGVEGDTSVGRKVWPTFTPTTTMTTITINRNKTGGTTSTGTYIAEFVR